MNNPFDPTTDPDRHAIWHMLAVADSDAFVLGDWAMVERDFDAASFEGIRCGHSTNPEEWKIAFATLAEYRDEWLASSRQFLLKPIVGMSHRDAVYHRIQLTQIDIAADRALAHKKFCGTVPLADGSAISGSRQTIYRLHKQAGVWRIVGFLGQLPLVQP